MLSLFLNWLFGTDKKDDEPEYWGAYDITELRELIDSLSESGWELIEGGTDAVIDDWGWQGAVWKKGNEYVVFEGDNNGTYYVHSYKK